MNWQEVCDSSYFQNLPFKIELNEWGQVVMSPATNKHGAYQSRINIFLMQILQRGECITECAIDTEKGVKVADVAWASDPFLDNYNSEEPFSRAPEICVEILSPSNTDAEMAEKMKLYFSNGAQEVWLCEEDGTMKFYDEQGLLDQSAIVTEFPQQIKVRLR